MPNHERWRFHIRGKVQGVWFRKTACNEASSLGLVVWIQNQEDGSIIAEAEGRTTELNYFVDWCKQGPPLSKVEEVSMSTVALVGEEDFEIRR